MSLAISITGKITIGQGLDLVAFNIAATGTYTAIANGGDIMDFSKATQDPAFQGLESSIQNSGSGPLAVLVNSGTGVFNEYVPIPGAAINNTKLKIGSTTYNTELGNGSSYPEASMSGIAIFKRWI